MGRAALAVGGAALIVAGVAVASGWWWHSDDTRDHVVPGRVDSVVIATESGSVRVTSRDVATASVHERLRYHRSRPDDAFRVEGTRLVLSGCGHNCSVDYEVVVPRGTAVTGRANSGDVLLDGVGATDVGANSGDIRVVGPAGPVKANVNSGAITVELTAPQDVRAESNSGDIDVTVPPDRYRVQAEARSGEEQVRVADDPAGTHVIDVRANSGDVLVKSA
ncbi:MULTISPECIES: DUF4097 family beta strand repeat-containing protein [Amycolatopsis]|uniref:DUF4097 family beta strand repeat-containing protein n=2 Tax=Amycolatopsis TaxID=1813 RepID=A0ABP9QHJ2_9PSEU|nr:DUF4097 family beta strand repeat-containing protein [Amycolatopsis sacchari]SFJ75322.1 Putative adhesin [Amycolatopsis sacchari]